MKNAGPADAEGRRDRPRTPCRAPARDHWGMTEFHATVDVLS